MLFSFRSIVRLHRARAHEPPAPLSATLFGILFISLRLWCDSGGGCITVCEPSELSKNSICFGGELMVRNSILATNNPVRLLSRIKAGHEVYVCPHTDCVNAGSWTGLGVGVTAGAT